MTQVQLAQKLYEIYCHDTDWKNYQGLPCPTWDNLTPAVQQHWMAVAAHVLETAEPIPTKL